VIGAVRGEVLERIPPGELLVDVAGLGYRVIVPTGTFADMRPGHTVVLHTHLHVREDALTLYGFAGRDERACFEALIGAHGVGPSLALSILSVHPPAALHRALADDDADALCMVPGVGKKTAARLLVELKSRLHVPDLDLAVEGNGDGTGRAPRGEVREALAQLGYAPDEIREAMAGLPAEGDVQRLLREALQRLAVSR
jgi:Holliday junction DNA helicase RuvA